MKGLPPWKIKVKSRKSISVGLVRLESKIIKSKIN